MWQARVRQHTRTGHGRQAAAVLADLAGSTHTLELTPDVQRRLCSATRLRPAGLRKLLGALVEEEFLALAKPNGPSSVYAYTLILGPQRGW